MSKNFFNLAVLSSFILLGNAAYAEAPDFREVTRNSFGNVITNSFGNCVRTQWSTSGDVCKEGASYQVARTTLAQEERNISFAFNQASLSPMAKMRLVHMANTLKSARDVKQVHIVGYADRIGNTAYNEKLSRKRAENVQKYLASQGFSNARVTDTRWFGETVPSTDCPNSLKRSELIDCLQKDRRVEVEIEYFPEGQTMGNAR